jgi:ribosome-associated protein
MTLSVRADSLAFARSAVTAAADKKANNILLLDLRGLSSLADFFVICSGVSERQLRAIADAIADGLQRDFDVRPHHSEGMLGGGWILLDYGDLVVHIFAPSLRAYYNLESLWSKAPVLLRMQ